MFEQVFKNVDDVLWKDAGCTSELDYTEQSSWLLFLKYLDSLETDRATEAKLEGKKYAFILDKPFRWPSWAAPKGKDGKIDHNTALTGDDLTTFVNGKLFPYLNYFLNSQIALDYGKTVMISSVNQANINGAKLKGYPIPAPPLSEQVGIVRELNALSTEIQSLERLCKSKLAALAALKRSLLQRAFTGQL